jgi:hypothetical protein
MSWKISYPISPVYMMYKHVGLMESPGCLHIVETKEGLDAERIEAECNVMSET